VGFPHFKKKALQGRFIVGVRQAFDAIWRILRVRLLDTRAALRTGASPRHREGNSRNVIVQSEIRRRRENLREENYAIMSGRRLAVMLLLCVGLLRPMGSAVAQNVKATFDKSTNFSKYKKYTWGSNYLLTQQTKEVQEQINMAIVDSINRNLRAEGFVEDDKYPDFRITYSAGGMPNADVGAQRYLYAADMQNYYWGGSLTGISSDVWVSSLAKMQITVTDAATKTNLWEATASQKIRDPRKFANNLQQNVDAFIQKAMKSFPPKK
jgi:hypothetical protein